jgi:hypothetical protein
MLARNGIGCPELLGARHNGRGGDVAAWNGCWLGSALTQRLEVNHRSASEFRRARWGGVGFPGRKTRGRVTRRRSPCRRPLQTAVSDPIPHSTVPCWEDDKVAGRRGGDPSSESLSMMKRLAPARFS